VWKANASDANNNIVPSGFFTYLPPPFGEKSRFQRICISSGVYKHNISKRARTLKFQGKNTVSNRIEELIVLWKRVFETTHHFSLQTTHPAPTSNVRTPTF